MPEVLSGILILLVLAGFAATILILRRRGATGGVEEELRGRVSDLEADADELRRRLQIENAERVQAQTRLETEREKLAEQRRLLEEAETNLKDAFKALSADALKESRQQFLSTAEERLKPFRETLDEYQKRLTEIEKAREGAYSGLRERLEALRNAHQALQKEANQLSTALRSPTVRGRWGEMALRNVVEAAGMSPHCDFREQASTATADGRIRPDLIVNLPNERIVVVDAKAPLDAYMEAMKATDETARRAALGRHARALRGHVQQLCQKSYWRQFENTPDFVVLFIPGESFFSAALEADQDLMEDAFRSNVVLASPATLIALLRAVACGWQEHALAENAARIAAAGQDLYDRVRVFAEKLAGVGSGLERATRSYNEAVGSYERRLEPGARRLAELGATTGKDLPDVEPVEGPHRGLAAPEEPFEQDAEDDAPQEEAEREPFEQDAEDDAGEEPDEEDAAEAEPRTG